MDATKKHIIRKRSLEKVQSYKKTTRPPPVSLLENHLANMEDVKQSESPEPVNIDYFLELMISNDDMLKRVFETMFSDKPDEVPPLSTAGGIPVSNPL